MATKRCVCTGEDASIWQAGRVAGVQRGSLLQAFFGFVLRGPPILTQAYHGTPTIQVHKKHWNLIGSLEPVIGLIALTCALLAPENRRQRAIFCTCRPKMGTCDIALESRLAKQSERGLSRTAVSSKWKLRNVGWFQKVHSHTHTDACVCFFFFFVDHQQMVVFLWVGLRNLPKTSPRCMW